jgi:hypothetical protein
MNKYLETPIKAARKADRDNMTEIILYRNYMVTTDGHRLHAIETEADHGDTPKQVSGKDAIRIDQIWKDATPTHHLQLDKDAIKRLKALVDAIGVGTQSRHRKEKQAGITVHFKGKEVHFSREASDYKTGRDDGLEIRYKVNGHPEQKELKFIVNGYYLLDLLTEVNFWTLSQEKEGAPIWFESGDKKACIMPMNQE